MSWKIFQNCARRAGSCLRQRNLRYERRFKPGDIPLLLKGLLLPVLFGRLFYGSWLAVIILLPMVIPWFIHQREIARKKENHDLGMQFRDAMMAVSTAQKAGYSIENSFTEAEHDMELLHGSASPICRELNRIEAGIHSSVPLEKLLEELGLSSGNRDIADFAAVFTVAKRNGGQMTQTIERTIEVIGQRLEVEKEIEVVISGKRMEAKVMQAVPFGIIAYIGVTTPGFFDPLYGNIPGVAVMTGCMAVYTAAVLMSEKIVDIEV